MIGRFTRRLGLGALWGGLIAVGLGLLWGHSHTPGARGRAPDRWPPGSRIPRVSGRTTVVLFAHPRCPCTRVSLGEFARILGHGSDKATAFVLFLKPAGQTGGWDWDPVALASAMPGITALCDEDGEEARRFGVATSGHVLAYGPGGRLCFSGGITSGRGQEGESAGGVSLAALLAGEEPADPETPVFGCPLFNTPVEVPGTREECKCTTQK